MPTNLADDVGTFTCNVYLLEGERPALVDVGAEFDVTERVRDHVEDIEVVALTHTHPDHVGNLDDVIDAFDPEVMAYDGSFEGVDTELDDGGEIHLGDDTYEVLHTPGHKNDHCCFYAREAGVLYAGDLVFADGAFGRTDIEEGDRDTLIESINRLLDVVDEDLEELHAGHGRSITYEPWGAIEICSQTAQF